VTVGIKAVGMPFRDSMGQAIGALSVAALLQHLGQRRTEEVAPRLRVATDAVGALLRRGRRDASRSAMGHVAGVPNPRFCDSWHMRIESRGIANWLMSKYFQIRSGCR
jgi:hypothetical protein